MSKILAISIVVMLLVGAPTLADWIPEDGHKMHYPQFPDPTGWDISSTYTIADDWQCSASGPVSDIHIWHSYEVDQYFDPNFVRVTIYDNIAPGVGGLNYSRPGNELWTRDMDGSEVTVQYAGSGPQGWTTPGFWEWRRPDHDNYYQLNIEQIKDPFYQVEGEVYWLSVGIWYPVGEEGRAGWKTSRDYFMDEACFRTAMGWFPFSQAPDVPNERIELAFVITPEPATLGVLMLGLIPVLLRRRH